jgi:hypothetical protein
MNKTRVQRYGKSHVEPSVHAVQEPFLDVKPSFESADPRDGTPSRDPDAEIEIARHELFAGLYSGRTVQRHGSGRVKPSQLVPSGGRALPDEVRAEMEAHHGADFSGVRVHVDDGAAEAMGAEAYTVGRDVVFKGSQWSPDTDEGKRLVAHELTHVVQQSRGPVAGTDIGGGVSVSDPSDSFEQEAEASAASFPVQRKTSVQRETEEEEEERKRREASTHAEGDRGTPQSPASAAFAAELQSPATPPEVSTSEARERDAALDGGTPQDSDELHGPEGAPPKAPPGVLSAEEKEEKALGDQAADEFTDPIVGPKEDVVTPEEKEDMIAATRGYDPEDVKQHAKTEVRALADAEANVRKAEIVAGQVGDKEGATKVASMIAGTESAVKVSPGGVAKEGAAMYGAERDRKAAQQLLEVERSTLKRKQQELEETLQERGVKKRGLSPLEI